MDLRYKVNSNVRGTGVNLYSGDSKGSSKPKASGKSAAITTLARIIGGPKTHILQRSAGVAENRHLKGERFNQRSLEALTVKTARKLCNLSMSLGNPELDQRTR